MKLNELLNAIYGILNNGNNDEDKIYNIILLFLIRYFDDQRCSSFENKNIISYETITSEPLNTKYKIIYENSFQNISIKNRIRQPYVIGLILPLFRDIQSQIYKENLIYKIYQSYPKDFYNIHNNITHDYVSVYMSYYLLFDWSHKINSIIDPMMGNGDLLCNVVTDIISLKGAEHKMIVDGYDIHQKNVDIAKINYLFNVDKINDDFAVMDCLKSGIDKKYDVVVSHIPISFNSLNYKLDVLCDQIKDIKMSSIDGSSINRLSIDGSCTEAIYLLFMTTLLNVDGKCSVIIPDAILFIDNPFYVQVRRYLVENFNIYKISYINEMSSKYISLAKSIIHFINNGKTEQIQFCDLRSEYEREIKCRAPYNEIVKCDYNLFYENYYLRKN